jgi:hypothetical protein
MKPSQDADQQRIKEFMDYVAKNDLKLEEIVLPLVAGATHLPGQEMAMLLDTAENEQAVVFIAVGKPQQMKKLIKVLDKYSSNK